MEPIRGREFLSNAIRYWEPRRILYNLSPGRNRSRPLCPRLTILQKRVAIQLIAASVRAGGVGERCVLRSLPSRCVCANVRTARFLAAIPMGVVRYRPGLRSASTVSLLNGMICRIIPRAILRSGA